MKTNASFAPTAGPPFAARRRALAPALIFSQAAVAMKLDL
jgi:hypothetical protein